MNYDEIMRSITRGLTGNRDRDVKYLMEQSEAYKTHELAREILRGIGRLMYEVAPPAKRGGIGRAGSNTAFGIQAAIEEVEFQMYKKNYSRAFGILESIIRKLETDKGELKMFRDDSVSEYHHFRNPLEEILYKELAKPKRTLRRIPEDIGQLYFIYGNLLFELKRFDEASVALKKAIMINPINVDAIFELAEISKLCGSLEDYYATSKKCLSLSYTGKSLARCYRNIGFYFVELKEYDVATALFHVSMNYDRQTTMAQSELYYIQQLTGETAPVPSIDEVNKVFEKYNLQLGPSNLIVSIAATLGKDAEKRGHFGAARFFYSILYDLTFDDEVREWLVNLPNEDS